MSTPPSGRPPSEQTIPDVLRWRAEHQPDQPAYSFVRDRQIVEETLTYRGVDAKAHAIAEYLRNRFKPGDRVLLLFPPGLDFVQAFWGVLYAGLIAVPAPPPDAFRLKHSAARLLGIAVNAGCAAAICTDQILALVRQQDDLHCIIPEDGWIPFERLSAEKTDEVAVPLPNLSTIAYLQYTSGSTGMPKGVMVSHANMVAQSRCITEAGGYDAQAVTLSWMPHFHDYGLVKGIIQPAWIGRPSYLMSPLTFLKRPLRWLEAVQRYRVSHSGGPNFAYRHCLESISPEERATLDLSSWKVASCGAEPIAAETVERFAEAFAVAGFRRDAFFPAYGMAEYTLLISLKRHGVVPTVESLDVASLEQGRVAAADSEARQVRRVVGCGVPVGDTRVVIADPDTRERCGPDRVGEIWLAGTSVAQGYWNDPVESERTFRAVLVGGQDGPYLRTGDLGFVKQGELFVTGRLKDLLIVRGRNHYPQDIERTVEQCHASFQRGGAAAFSVEQAGEEAVVVVQEVERQANAQDLDEWAAAIRSAISEQHDLQVWSIVFIKSGSLPKTSSGKVQRRACRSQFLSGLLKVVGECRAALHVQASRPAALPKAALLSLSAEVRRRQVELELRAMLAERLRRPVEELPGDCPISRLGLDSVMAAELLHRVETAFDVVFSLQDLLGENTVADLADRIMAGIHSTCALTDANNSSTTASGKSDSLSENQSALWFLSQLSPESAAANVSAVMRVPSDLEEARLAQVLEQLAERHATLRTTYATRDDLPIQVLHDALPIDWSAVNASGWDWERLRRECLEASTRPFDLMQGTPWRAILFRRNQDAILLLVAHHIAVDGWSLALLAEELKERYEAAGRTTDRLPRAGGQPSAAYGEFVAWHHRLLEGEEGQRQSHYWKARLAGELPEYDSLYDRPQNGVEPDRYRWHAFRIEQPLFERLKAFARQEGTTLYTLCLSALQLLLSRYTRQEETLIAAPVFGRTRAQFAGTVGDFVNMVVLRERLDEAWSGHDLLSHTKQLVLEALAHQDYPYARLVSDLRRTGTLRRPALAQVLFVLQRFRLLAELDAASACRNEEAGPSSMWEPYVIPQQSGQFDLCVELAEGDQGLCGYLEYKAQLFTAESIARIQGHYVRLLESLVAAPTVRIGELPLMAEAERQTILGWSRPAGQVPPDICLHRLIELQVQRTPDAIALRQNDQTCTYRDLDQQANRLAHYLRRRGVQPGVVVGLCVERSPNLIVGLLGILKAGGAYLPLDADYPTDRLEYMLKDSQVRVLVTQQDQLVKLPTINPHTICLDTEWSEIARCSDEPVEDRSGPDDLAYVIYTSGSTGRPKGVMIEHRSVVNYTQAILAATSLTARDRVLQFASVSFDTAVEEIFPCLIAGATLVLRTTGMVDSVSVFLECCRAWRITVLDLPTAYWHEVVTRMESEGLTCPDSVKTVVIGGERVLPHIVRRWTQLVGTGRRLLNTYGPTETTVAATVADLTGWGGPGGSAEEVPIGRAIPGASVYILDRLRQPVPIGVMGELYIGGVGVARGYRGRPDLTEDKFVLDPFVVRPGGRLYRTGDLARWRQDGQLDYRGRADRQVKIRGYRIELEEIEAVLNRQPDLEQAVVDVREDQPGDKRIVAFIVPRPHSRSGLVELREQLRLHLPAPMIPSSFVELQALPLTANGKVDRRALQVDQDSRTAKVELTSSYQAPRNATEQLLADIWGEILHVRDVGVHDNFFELGGHSLLATQLVSRIQSLFQTTVPLRRVFERPTIATLSEIIMASKTERVNVPGLSVAMTKVPRGVPLPLSFAQERMWFLYRLSPGAAAYNIPASVRLQGPLNLPALRWSVAELVRRHEVLRTTFAQIEGVPRQMIHESMDPIWTDVDLRTTPREERESRARELATAEARRPFDLERGPLMRILLIQIGEEDHVLMLNTHHIISDQWSYGVIARELVKYYNAFCSGKPFAVDSTLDLQYADFAQWQRAWLTGPILEEQLAHWRSRLQDLPVVTLPADYPRPPVHAFKGDHVSLDLSWSLIQRLKQLSVREGVTLYMVFLAGFFAFLYRLTQQRDLVIGTPIANRNRLETEHLIGTFVNTLALRMAVSGDMSFRELLKKVCDVSLDAYAHQDMPFDKLVEELRPDRSLGGLPFVQVLFNFANTPFARTDFHQLSWTPYEVSRGAAQLDLGLSIDPLASRKAYLEFNTDLFDRSTAERWLGHYRELMESIAGEIKEPVGRLSLLSERERHRILREWNHTAAPYEQVCFPQRFEAQVARTPDAVAVQFETTALTYRELNARANRWAHDLRERGVGPDVVVPVFLERSLELLIAILAVMKAGGAYLPLVPGLPAKRLATMLEASRASLVVTDSELRATLPPHQLQVVCMDREAERVARCPEANLSPLAGPRHLAYVLFTSGSTGQPKGVEIEHRALMNFLVSMEREPGLTDHDVMMALTPLSFDIAGLELYLPLMMGARVLLATRRQAMEGVWLQQQLDQGDITVMQATPATWRMVLQSGWQGRRKVKCLCGGEALPRDLADEVLARGGSLWNLYGPTETTIWSTLERVRGRERTVSLGRPIANTQVYVLDLNRQPMPVGIPGELSIGGLGLARGYRGAPQLTAERFIANPFQNGERLYRTGDVVKWLPDGRLEYVGRVDHQVKLRGFRIELGEIEAVLAQEPSVKQAVVVVREDVPGDKRLVAYVTAQAGERCDPQSLRRTLRETLPDYMVPAAIVPMEAFPLTPNGKVDRTALPAPSAEPVHADGQPVEPRNRIELQLTAIWEQVLGVTPIGVRDNFFSLGGYSLLALRLFSAIEQTFGIRLPMAVLFQAPTIERLAEVLAQEGGHVRWRSLVAIQPSGPNRPFFAVPGVGGNVLVFARLATLLGEQQPFYGLQSRGLDGKERPFMRVEDMAAHYVEEIRSVQPHGPYLIGGTCTGGLVAYEIAQQLTAQGEAVILTIMESWHPRSYGKHWSRPPYLLWPLLFVAMKMRTYLRLMSRLPAKSWPGFWKDKVKRLWSLMHHTESAEHQDEFLYKDQVTYATFHAVARYRMKPYHGQVLNVIASKHPLTNSTDDTRLVFGEWAMGMSRTIYLPAEDSGRLFVAPHVQELASHLKTYWQDARSILRDQPDERGKGPSSQAA